MIRRKGPILAAGIVAAFALGWYRGLFGVQQEAAPPAAPVEARREAEATAAKSSAPADDRAQTGEGAVPPESAKPSQPASAPSEPAVQQAQAPAASDVPGFDIVRVEPDGSTVVAGKGAANERIALKDGSRTYGEAKTDANGDFVMTLSLPAGSHRLQLAQREDVLSDDAAVVNVPPAGQPDQLLVMMQRPGEASEVLQRPTEAAVSSSAAASTPGAEPAGRQPEPQVAAVAPAPEPALESAARPEPPAATVSVEAVEIEGDNLFVAGSAKAGSTVRIYLDDKAVVDTRSGAGDRFIATARTSVPVGDHSVRADVVDAGGQVVARVEVPFQRPEGPSMAAIAAPPQAPVPVAPTGNGPATAPSEAAVARDARIEAPQSAAPGGEPAAIPGAPATEPTAAQAAQVPAAAAAEGEPETVYQAPLQASAARVIIRRGDTLWRISRETYGRGSRYTVIYLANGDQIRDPDRIYPGQVFRVPEAGEAGAPPNG